MRRSRKKIMNEIWFFLKFFYIFISIYFWIDKLFNIIQFKWKAYNILSRITTKKIISKIESISYRWRFFHYCCYCIICKLELLTEPNNSFNFWTANKLLSYIYTDRQIRMYTQSVCMLYAHTHIQTQCMNILGTWYTHSHSHIRICLCRQANDREMSKIDSIIHVVHLIAA